MHNLTGIAGIRFIALSGVRRGECQKLLWDEVDAEGTCLAIDETKTGPSLRPLSRAAYAVIDELDPISDYVFAAGPKRRVIRGCPSCGARCRRLRDRRLLKRRRSAGTSHLR
jgi:integrase